MPRIEFKNLDQADKWINDKVLDSNKGYYGYYNTTTNELILSPSKSTRPIFYGLVRNTKMQDVIDYFKETTVVIYTCDDFEWDSDHIPRR